MNIATIFGLVLILVSIPVFIWDRMDYTKGKGNSKWVCLVGLVVLIGVIILIILSDQDHYCSVNQMQIHKLVGLIFFVLGTALLVFGRLLDGVEYASIFIKDDVSFRHRWPSIFMFLESVL